MSSSAIFYVCPSPDGGWSVFGSDIAPALSTFDARSAAMEYARIVAQNVAPAEVRLLGWNGSVEEYRVKAGEGSAVAMTAT